MAGNLLGREDRLLHGRQCADLTQLGQLHVLQTLGILGQAHMTHAAFDVIHEPPLAVHRHDRDLVASDVAAVFQHLATAHDVLVDLAALHPTLTDFLGPDSIKHCLKFFVFFEVAFGVSLFLAVDRLEDPDDLGRFLDPVNLGDIDDIRRGPVEHALLNALGPGGRVIFPDFAVCVPRHRRQHKAHARV